MSQTFKDLVALDVANIFNNANEFGESIAYRESGVTTSVTAHVIRQAEMTRRNEYGEFRVKAIEALIATTDVVKPAVSKGELIIDGETWAVVDVTPKIGCHMVRAEQVARINTQTTTRLTR